MEFSEEERYACCALYTLALHQTQVSLLCQSNVSQTPLRHHARHHVNATQTKHKSSRWPC
jgi:hypothetical protein